MAKSIKRHFETRTGDSGGLMLRIEFLTRPNGVLRELRESIASSTLEVDSVLQMDGAQWLAFLTVTGKPKALRPTIDRLADVELLYDQSFIVESDTCHVVVVVRDTGAFIPQTLARNRAIPHSIVLKNRTLEGVVTVRDWDHLRSVANAIETTHDEFELLSVTQVDRVGSLLGSDRFKQTIRSSMTAEQLRTLETAHQMGYFTVPQDVTANEVAAKLGVSQSTFSERIRRAIDSLLALAFREEADTSAHE